MNIFERTIRISLKTNKIERKKEKRNLRT